MTLSDRDAQIVELYRAGYAVPQIAARVGRRCAYVKRLLGALNLKQPKRRKQC